MNSLSAAAVIERLKMFTNTESDNSLASKLDVSPQTLSTWKSRNKVPYSICVYFSQITNVSLDWLITGEGPMMKNFANEVRSPELDITRQERCWLELFRGLPEEVQKNILRDAEKEKRFLELEEEVRKLKGDTTSPEDRKNAG